MRAAVTEMREGVEELGELLVIVAVNVAYHRKNEILYGDALATRVAEGVEKDVGVHLVRGCR